MAPSAPPERLLAVGAMVGVASRGATNRSEPGISMMPAHDQAPGKID